MVVDDGSEDKTSDLARAAGATILRSDRNIGKGRSLVKAFAYATEHGFRAILTLDGDGQHNPADIARFLDRYEASRPKEILLGCRLPHTSSGSMLRRFVRYGLNRFVRRLIAQDVPDTQCGFRLYPIATVRDLALYSGRFAAESEILLLLAKKGVRIRSVQIENVPGEYRSAVNLVRDGWEFFRMLWFHRELLRPRMFSARAPLAPLPTED